MRGRPTMATHTQTCLPLLIAYRDEPGGSRVTEICVGTWCVHDTCKSDLHPHRFCCRAVLKPAAVAKMSQR